MTRPERVRSCQGRDRVSYRSVPSLLARREWTHAETVDRLVERHSARAALHALADEFGVEHALVAELLRERGVKVCNLLVSDDDTAEATARCTGQG